jgi:hypothetical protein
VPGLLGITANHTSLSLTIIIQLYRQRDKKFIRSSRDVFISIIASSRTTVGADMRKLLQRQQAVAKHYTQEEIHQKPMGLFYLYAKRPAYLVRS